jgi:predicted dehydrogenase
MSDDIRVAIVGAGIIGRNHAAAMGRLGGVRVVAIVDTIPAAAESLAAGLAEAGLAEAGLAEAGGDGPCTYDTLTAALSAGGIDLVAICTPTGWHASAAIEALEAGVHVVVEKPADVSLGAARALAEAAERAASRGVICSVVSQHRFDPASVVVAEAIASGRLGRLTSAVASVTWWRPQEYYDSADWRGTWEFDGGGATFNQGIHTVDLLLWFLGRPVEIYAETALLAHERIEVEDVAVATVRFESGALAVLHATTSAYPGLDVLVQVHGARGSAVLRDDQLAYFHVAGGTDGDQSATVVGAPDLHGNEKVADAFVVGHERQYADVVDAIRTRRAPAVTAQDALLALATVHAVYLSATRHEPVRFEDVMNGVYDDVPLVTGGSR